MSEMNGSAKTELGQGDGVAPVPPQPAPAKGWVQFENDDGNNDNNKDAPAVIATESVQLNLERSISKTPIENNTTVPVLDPKPLRNVELPVATVEPIRQGFCKNFYKNQDLLESYYCCSFSANGDIIVTLLPVNTRFPWVTPAQFRPELVPEELMAQGLTVSCI